MRKAISTELLTKRNVSIAVILVSFVALTVASVIDQGAGMGFVIILSLFCIMVIGLGPFVLGK